MANSALHAVHPSLCITEEEKKERKMTDELESALALAYICK